MAYVAADTDTYTNTAACLVTCAFRIDCFGAGCVWATESNLPAHLYLLVTRHVYFGCIARVSSRMAHLTYNTYIN